MKRVGVFLPPPPPPPCLDGMRVHRRVTPSSKFAGAHLYSWVERGTVRVNCLAQPEFESGSLNPECSALTISPLRLPQKQKPGNMFAAIRKCFPKTQRPDYNSRKHGAKFLFSRAFVCVGNSSVSREANTQIFFLYYPASHAYREHMNSPAPETKTAS